MERLAKRWIARGNQALCAKLMRDLLLSLDAGKELRKWLDQRIAELERLLAKDEAAESEAKKQEAECGSEVSVI